MLAGEYVVLDGAPAICMAVDRRVRVSLAVTDADEHCVSAPGFLHSELAFSAISEIERQVPLLAAVWRQFESAASSTLRIEIDTRDFHSGEKKLGIGSSAAAIVALVAAFDALFETGCDVLRTAIAAHRDLQNGRGSGADVACSFAGDLVEYRMRNQQAQQLSWPAGLCYALLWSGQPSSTRSQLEKRRQFAATAAAESLEKAVEEVVTAWRSCTAADILVEMRTYAAALQRYDNDHKLGIYAAGHAELAGLAESTDVVYKPCGAGGGDFGVAMAVDPQALHNFVTAARDNRFKPADLVIDPTGVAVESNQQ